MPTIAEYRLSSQQLVETACQTPGDVAAWLGAVQAQDYAGALWALGIRLRGASEATVEQAMAEGSILRTHVMRPTWHFVAPADIRWLLALTAPRVHAVNAFMHRKLELDDALFVRSNVAIETALRHGKHLTRPELAAVLEQAGIVAAGFRLSYMMMHAELDGLVCSGARRGKQFTYALLAERAPHARLLPREEALAELTRRYFASHGPATVRDFAWWSGLATADVKAGLELARPHLAHETVDGTLYWRSPAAPALRDASLHALLLPPYDEYTIAYKDHSATLDPVFSEQAKTTLFGGTICIDGQIVGYWRRSLGKGAVLVETAPFRPLTAAEQDAVAAAAQRYGAFLGLPATVV